MQRPRPRPAAWQTPWELWHRWCDERADRRIQAAFDEWLCDLIAEALTAEGRELIDTVREGFRKRDERIATLEGKLDTLLAIVGGAKSADVVPLPGSKQHG
jgi:hypothetical protein